VALEIDAKCKGMFVNNVYDVDSKSFLLKLTKPGGEKVVVVIESGVRFHTTKFVKETPDMPSGFSMKLRKHIRQKRILSITRIGTDRVVDFCFGYADNEEATYHVILELYARGNVILTDYKYNVLSLIRYFKDDEVRFAVGECYLTSLEKSNTTSAIVSPESVRDFLKSSNESSVKKANLKQLLSSRSSVVNSLGPDLIEHCIVKAGLNPSMKLSHEIILDDDFISKLTNGLTEFSDEYLSKLDDLNQPAGVLLLEKNDTFYDRFDAVVLAQHSDSFVETYADLDEAVDIYYSKIDIQKLAKSEIAQKAAARKKVESIQQDQEKRISTLEEEVVKKERAAEAIANHLQQVDNGLLIIRSAVAFGMSWNEIDELIASEKAKQNPIALLIESTQFHQNQITMKLEESNKPLFVSLDINVSAFANIALQYKIKKATVEKVHKTVDAAKTVLSHAQKKFEKEMEKQKQKRIVVRPQRKIHFFEKFQYFVSSEGFLVLSGKDAQQNELLVKKYLRSDFGDIYVHADLHGASSCIVRSPRKGVAIPPETLRQAGAMTVCNSSAWSAKIVTSAWWVHAEQVSKTAPTGEYLSTGSFMIRGKKNFLPPCRLELSFGMIFKLDETQASFDERKQDWRVRDDFEGEVEYDVEPFVESQVSHFVGAAPKSTMLTNKMKPEVAVVVKAKKDPTAVPRGKKGKLKKMKKKYGDQTEEERQLAMIALGHPIESPQQQDNEDIDLDIELEYPKPLDKQESKEESIETMEQLEDDLPPKVPKKKQVVSGEPVESDNSEINLRSFTCNPQPGDTLLYAMPFCGPPQATVNFKFRLKLIPGSMKRGRAAKTALESMMRSPGCNEAEKEIMRLIPDNDLIQTMAASVKIMGPGINATTKALKNEKIKSKKQS